jgi:hypothetical protein
MTKHQPVPAAILQSLLTYDPETGKITRKSNGMPVYHERTPGGPRMELSGRKYDSRRMAWALHTGEWPPHRRLKTRGDRYDLRASNFLVVPEGEQYCPTCDTVKPIQEFHQNPQRKSGHGTYCKPCSQRRHQQTKDKYDEKNLAKKYGLSVFAYRKLVREKGGKCWICGAEPNGKRLSVDHCHKTNGVRGLLCQHCNTGLGHFRDSPKLLLTAAKYLLDKL